MQNYVLAELVDRAADKRRLDIEPDVLAQIKALCRAREDTAAAAADLLLDHLKANDAQVRRWSSAEQVCLLSSALMLPGTICAADSAPTSRTESAVPARMRLCVSRQACSAGTKSCDCCTILACTTMSALGRVAD